MSTNIDAVYASSASEAGASQEIVFVTGNEGKRLEVQACLAGHVRLESVMLDLPEMQSASVAEISRQKSLAAYDVVRRPVLVEDSALCFEALAGLPGAYCRWFFEGIGACGLTKLLAGFDTRRAWALCVFSYCERPGVVVQFEGRCDGRIAEAPRGNNGFGWDCIFEPDEGGGQTFAEMSAEQKKQISHRAKALELLKNHFCH